LQQHFCSGSGVKTASSIYFTPFYEYAYI
ncbi:hypothetical protein C5S35_03900, partial [Candidatus Methanophagaceae archaeon]